MYICNMSMYVYVIFFNIYQVYTSGVRHSAGACLAGGAVVTLYVRPGVFQDDECV